MADGPSLPDPNSPTAKFAQLWITNKPLAIFLIFLITALIAGIIFVIVWFAVIVPNQNKNDQNATVAQASATYTLTPPSSSTSSSTSSGSTTPAHFMRLRHN